MRRTTIRRLLAVSLCLVVFGATPAAAVVIDRDTGFDDRDIEPRPGFDPDIRSSSRKVATHDGRRMLAIIVRFYERDAGWGLEIRLDSRGGPRADHVMSTLDECYVWRKGHHRDFVVGRSSARGDRYVCRVPVRVVSPSKPIRWKLHTKVPDGSRRGFDFEIDYAPSDNGWYA